MINILMIEDDTELAEILTEYLEQFDMNITVAEDPYIGLSTLDVKKIDFVILDLTLPGIDGLDVCKEIRKSYNIPILISSARHDIMDKVTAFENGADDYLPKPYNPMELKIRIESHLRRFDTSNVISNSNNSGDIILEPEKRSIKFKNKDLILTNAEYEILSYLVIKEGGVVSREELIYNCEAINEESANKSIDVIIGRIRNKLGENTKSPRYIHAIRGIGYKYIK